MNARLRPWRAGPRLARWSLAVAVLLTLAAGSLLAPVAVAAEEDPACEDLVKDAIAQMVRERYQDALASVQRAFADSPRPSDCSAYCLQTKSCAYLSLGQTGKAAEALVQMLRDDPHAPYDPQRFPRSMNRFYRTVRDSVLASIEQAGTLDIRTVAVLDFEVHNWVGHRYEDYDVQALGAALQMIVTSDLVEATNLVVVDRTNMKDVLAELELAANPDLADAGNAIRLGRLLNAHAFVDGQISFIDQDLARIDIKVIHAATSRVLTRHYEGDFASGSELLKLQRGVLALVTEALNEFREDVQHTGAIEIEAAHFDQLAAANRDNDRKMETWLLAGEALEREDRDDLRGAIDRWEAVLAVDPDHELARTRVWALGVDLERQ